MGQVCTTDSQVHRQMQQLPMIPLSNRSTTTQEDIQKYMKMQSLSHRFGDVEKLRKASVVHHNLYTFILPVRHSPEQSVQLQCPIISCPADQMALSNQIISSSCRKSRLVGPPIIDFLDSSDLQVHYKYQIFNSSQQRVMHENQQQNQKKPTIQPQQVLVKIYTFEQYRDLIFKNGLYEAGLYKTLNNFTQSNKYMKEMFLLQKGKKHSIVYLYNSCLCTLADVLQYRQIKSIPYTNEEQLYVGYRLLTSYLVLERNNIAHRDIRPSKVFLCDPLDITALSYSDSGVTKNGSYQLLNLQSARKLNDEETRQLEISSRQLSEMYMTVKGVSHYACESVKQMISRKDEAGSYSYREHDRVGLAKTLYSIATLDCYPENMDLKQVSESNKQLAKIIYELLMISPQYSHMQHPYNDQHQVPLQAPSLQNIHRNLTNLLAFKYSSSLANKTVNHTSHNLPSSILSTDYGIATAYIPSLLTKLNKQRIEHLETQCMFALHQKELFKQKLQKMIQENEAAGNLVDNIAIMNRIGQYYEHMGIKDNDYYHEEINLLLEAAEEERGYGFNPTQYVERANEIYANKVSSKIKNSLTKNLRNQSESTKVKILVETAYTHYYNEQLNQALQTVNLALEEATNISDLAFKQQMQVLEAKGVLESSINPDSDLPEQLFLKGIELCNEHSTSKYRNIVEVLGRKSDFEYLLALCHIYEYEKGKRESIPIEVRQKLLKRANTLLQKALTVKIDLPVKNVGPIARLYEGIGDLEQARESYQSSLQSYERAYRLYVNSERKFGSRPIIQILKKKKRIYANHIDNQQEQNKLDKTIASFKQKRDGRRTNLDRIRYANKKTDQAFGEGVIREVEQSEESDSSRKK